MFLSIKIKKIRIFYLQIFIFFFFFFFFFCGKLFRNLIGIFSKCIDVFCLVKICVFTLRVFVIREIFRSLTYLKYIFKMFVTFNNVLTASILLCVFNSHKLPHFPYYIVKMCYLHDYDVKVTKIWKQRTHHIQKMGVSVLLKLFLRRNEICNTAYAL